MRHQIVHDFSAKLRNDYRSTKEPELMTVTGDLVERGKEVHIVGTYGETIASIKLDKLSGWSIEQIVIGTDNDVKIVN